MSSNYVEIPEFDSSLKFRTLQNDGLTVVYPHLHKEIEIIYAKHGNVRIGVNDDIIDLQEGEIIFFASGELHYFLASPDSERYVYQFDLKLFDENLLRKKEIPLLSLFAEGEPHSRHWPPVLVNQACDILLELFEQDLEQQAGGNYLILGNLHRFISLLYTHLPKRKSENSITQFPAIQYKETLERLDKVFAYIENSYQETITLEDIAKLVGFSPYYFTRFFKRNTGQTFGQYLTEYRLNQAKFILAEEKIPMAEVAEKSGFSSVKTFHHVFKEAVGQSPLQYQKNLNG